MAFFELKRNFLNYQTVKIVFGKKHTFPGINIRQSPNIGKDFVNKYKKNIKKQKVLLAKSFAIW